MSSLVAPGETRGQVLRFLAVGGSNAAVNGALLIVLAHLLPFPLAYAICYVSGLVVATSVTARVVFRTHLSLPRAVRFVGVYVSVYVFGLAVSRVVAVELHDPSPTVVAVAVIALTAPLNFLGGRFVFAR